jgi:hypothetical protein
VLALVYLPGTALIFIFSGASAQLGARLAPRTLVSGGLGLVARGLALQAFAGAHSSWTMLEPGFLLASIGTGLLNPVLAGLSLASAPATMSGLASGVSDTARQAGIAIGIAGLGAFVPSHAIAHHSQSFVSGFHTAAWVAAALAILGALTTAHVLRAGALAADHGRVPVGGTA